MGRKVISMMMCGAITLYGFGCTHTEVHSPEHLSNGSGENIIVVMKDGRTIQFQSGEYAVLNTDGGMIQGRGRLVIDREWKTYREFQGTVRFDEILNITTTHMTTVGTAGVVGLASVIVVGAILIIWLYTFHPRLQ